MSKYEWERGTLVIPDGAWDELQRGLVAEANRRLLGLRRQARDFYQQLVAAGRGCADFNYEEAWRKLTIRGYQSGRAFVITHDDDPTGELRDLLFPDEFGLVTRPPREPHDADFKLLPNDTLTFACSSFGLIALNAGRRELTWIVQENNHASEDARGHPLAGWLFRQLGRIHWTPGTGGVIVGNDEYHRDSQSEGGGGNYAVARYGPLGGSGTIDG
jgi:hypothetical protein